MITTPIVAAVLHACSSEAPDATPPAQVTDLRVEAFTETTAVLVWTAPGDDGDRGRATEYDLRVALGAPATDWVTADTAQTSLPVPGNAGATEQAAVRGLTPAAVAYFALLTADDSGNWSAFSNVLRVDPGDPAPPARVTDLTAIDLAPHAVTLTFTAPGDDSLSGTAAAYDVRFSPSPLTEATWEGAPLLPVPGTPLPGCSPEQVRVAGLSPGTTVHLALRAQDDAGRWSTVSNDMEVTLPPDTIAPGTITDLAVAETGIRTATLRWTAPGNDGDEATVDGYEIRYTESRIKDEADWTAATTAMVSLAIVQPGSEQTAVLTSLPAPATLWFAVRATDDAGNRGGLSNGISGYVPRAPRSWVIQLGGGGDAPTVQAGIDSSVSGDTVLVMPGRYYENLDYEGKDVVVRSEAGPETAILDGSRKKGSVVVFQSSEGHGAVLEGFTITGGVGELYGTIDEIRRGGGVLVLSSQPTIRANWITGNSAGRYGGGIQTVGGPAWSPVIEGNRITDNHAWANGGGIGFLSSGVIENNVIEGNLNEEGDGGGIWAWNPGYTVNVVIRGNRIVGNEAGDHGGGIHVAMSTSQVEVAFNVVANNRARGIAHIEFSGGGVWLYGGDFWVHHNTIVFNDARGLSDPSWGGGGIAVLKAGPKLIENNIIAYSTYGGGIRCESVATFEVRNNLAWSNVGGDGNGSCVDWTSTNGNLAVDPRFCDRGVSSGDYSLAADSPALLHPAGPLGAFPIAGCDAPSAATPPLPVQGLWGGLTWNRISSLYR